MKQSDSSSIFDLPSNLKAEERDWLNSIFTRYGGQFPSLDEKRKLMDEVWEELQCDHYVMDERIASFYSHPVWLLTGMFIEQHALSLSNRQKFTAWVATQAPLRVGDFGGGYGTLARMIGNACPEAEVEVIEPHPHPAAVECAAATPNVKYQQELTGEYDILIATDVFEHVPDPLSLVYNTASKLSVGGQYLIANCFWPVVLCHLPQTFHFRYSWNKALSAMGLLPKQKVCYGRVFLRYGDLEFERAKKIEKLSQQLYPWIELFPAITGRRILGELIITFFSKISRMKPTVS